MVKLRLHHLFCLQGFQDFGYNEEFINIVRSTINLIKNSPSLRIKLISSCDCICSACPYMQNNVCVRKFLENDLTMKEKEENISQFIDVKLDKFYRIDSLFNLINEKITTKDLANELLCDGCEWRSICSWYKSRL